MEKTLSENVWVCDRCKKEVSQRNRPNKEADPWSRLMIDQPTGFDAQGCSWRKRMDKPLDLCGECTEEIVKIVNGNPKPINIIFDGPPAHEAGRFIEVETDDGKGISCGEWIEKDGGPWALRITELPK